MPYDMSLSEGLVMQGGCADAADCGLSRNRGRVRSVAGLKLQW
jgi:hypothetical protein